MEYFGDPCLRDSADKAKLRLQSILFLSYLRDSARDPYMANGLRTLEGMAQDTCIYEFE